MEHKSSGIIGRGIIRGECQDQKDSSLGHFNLEGHRDPERVSALSGNTQPVRGKMGLYPWFLAPFLGLFSPLTGGKQVALGGQGTF